MLDHSTSIESLHTTSERQLRTIMKVAAWLSGLMAASALAVLFALPVFAQRAQQANRAKPVVVQPGAPGQPTRTLPPSTRATLPPRSPADVEFMQGMIMHHAQAVEMTALIESHTANKNLRALGARISSSQSDEIKFMKRWLEARGEPLRHNDARNAGHGYVEPFRPCDAMTRLDAGDAYRKADGRSQESEGRRV